MTDVTPFRTALAAITAPPCDAGCRWRPTCAEGRRACRAFLSYLRLAPASGPCRGGETSPDPAPGRHDREIYTKRGGRNYVR